VGAQPGVIGALVPFPGYPPDAALRGWLRRMADPEAETQKIVMLSSEGRDELLPKLAAELVALRPSVILTWGDPGARAAQAATTRIPIVVMTEDLLAAGHVDNMSRPGGNMTGVSVMGTELDAKRLELLASLLPPQSTVMVLDDGVTAPVSRPAMRQTAQALSLKLSEVTVRTPQDIQAALEGAAKRGIAGVNIVASSPLHAQMENIIGWANAARLPAIVPWGFFVDAGALISYGPQLNPLYRRLLSKVLGLMRGGKVADFPVELPTHFELVVNLKTAKAIGVEIPRAILLRADRVVE
jgi:putative ABC transport system substrate-binding protein